MNEAEGLRSTFGFNDMKGKPKELGFCFYGKTNIFLGSFAPSMVPSTPGCSMDNINNNIIIINTTTTRILLEPGLIRAGSIPREERHLSPPAENSRAPHVWFLCNYTPFLLLKTKHPSLAPLLLSWGGVTTARTFPEPGG